MSLLLLNIGNLGDWGLGIGDWGLGIGDWAQSPIPKSPIYYYLIYLHNKKLLKLVKIK